MTGTKQHSPRYRCPLYATNLSDECEVVVSSRRELIEHIEEEHYSAGKITFIEEVTDAFLDVMAYIRGLERYRK